MAATVDWAIGGMPLMVKAIPLIYRSAGERGKGLGVKWEVWEKLVACSQEIINIPIFFYLSKVTLFLSTVTLFLPGAPFFFQIYLP